LEQIQTIFNLSSTLWWFTFIWFIRVLSSTQLLHLFLNFFCVFPPIYFHFYFIILLSLAHKFFLTILEPTSLAILLGTIITWIIMRSGDANNSKWLFFQLFIYHIFFIAGYFIKSFIVWVYFVMNLLITEIFAKKVKSSWNHVSAITFVIVDAMTDSVW